MVVGDGPEAAPCGRRPTRAWSSCRSARRRRATCAGSTSTCCRRTGRRSRSGCSRRRPAASRRSRPTSAARARRSCPRPGCSSRRAIRSALADAVVALLRDPERRKAMATASRARHAERFTVERMVAETAAVYDAVLRGGRQLRLGREAARSAARIVSRWRLRPRYARMKAPRTAGAAEIVARPTQPQLTFGQRLVAPAGRPAPRRANHAPRSARAGSSDASRGQPVPQPRRPQRRVVRVRVDAVHQPVAQQLEPEPARRRPEAAASATPR